ncbi:MAG: hypothetical protein K9J17_03255 [Flavobacteriales bacterium]|nr:hypothetical protein [Flavobacteriales bacterium]
MELGHLIEQTVRQKYLEPKKLALIEKLVDFILHKAPTMLSDHQNLVVINFEYDSQHYFSFTGYPDPSIVDQYHWLDQFTIDVSEENDNETLDRILDEINVFENDDWILEHRETGITFEHYNLFSRLVEEFFADCWKRAKINSISSYRCFLFIHDLYDGIDCDTGLPASDGDVQDILRKEGTTFTEYPRPDPWSFSSLDHKLKDFWSNRKAVYSNLHKMSNGVLQGTCTIEIENGKHFVLGDNCGGPGTWSGDTFQKPDNLFFLPVWRKSIWGKSYQEIASFNVGEQKITFFKRRFELVEIHHLYQGSLEGFQWKNGEKERFWMKLESEPIRRTLELS